MLFLVLVHITKTGSVYCKCQPAYVMLYCNKCVHMNMKNCSIMFHCVSGVSQETDVVSLNGE